MAPIDANSRGNSHNGRSRDELAFLPAALEVVETPPSPLGRAIAVTISLTFCACIAWATFGSVDIVATAYGKVVPTGRTKVVQPLEAGVVRSIRVRDGQAVSAGEVLIELDPTVSAAELARFRSDWISSQLDVARLQAALTEDPAAAFRPPAEASAALIETHRRFLASQSAEQDAKLASIDRQHAQKEAERSTVTAMVDKLEATLPLLEQRVNVRRHLAERELGSKLQYLAELQELTAQEREIAVLKSRAEESHAAIASVREARAKAVAEYRRSLFDELTKAEQKAAGLSQELVKAEQKARLQQLVSPVDGTVQQLAVHTVGGVVTAAQPLLVVVPADSEIEIEAVIPGRDIGFVRPGQDAEIKLDAFNFTRYGLSFGKVLNISSDAVAAESLQGRQTSRSVSSRESRQPIAGDLEYVARVSVDRTRIAVEDRLASLAPGMTATVEIKTGSRPLINYLLSPLARYRQESFRER